MNPFASVRETGEALRAGKISCRELAEAAFARIAAADGKLHAFLSLDRKGALARADALDAEARAGRWRGPLHGVTLAVKDNICVRELPATCASRILENYVPGYTATAVERLDAAGAVVLGKTNLDEFAMGSSTEHGAFGATCNPWNTDCAPGGSSGGSAAAVASGEAVLALGSDTGGSIRQPAALCGVVGLKPTYGRVSRYGLVAFGSSLDQIGPFARRVEDAALCYAAMAGRDARDSTSAKAPIEPFASEGASLAGLRVGLLEESLGEGVHPGVRAVVEKTAELLRRGGASVERVSIPAFRWAVPAYYLVANSEASSNLARYDGVRYGRRTGEADNLEALYLRSRSEGFGAEVKRRIMLGTYALSSGYYEAYYARGQKLRRLLIENYAAVFAGVDVIFSPTTPDPAFRLGERLDDPVKMYLSDIFTVSANLAGLPALSQPAGLSAEGLPVGIQWTAPAFEENRLFRAAHALEKLLDFHYEGLAV
jgi:aspartyl-tRNA(Asn)/glutamyl-tRNA(Gln) amidotransferase subunit A